MSTYSSSIFSDDELIEELRNIGFEDVPPEILSLIKEDLAKYVDNELFSSDINPFVTPESSEKTVKAQSPKLNKAGKSTTSPIKRCPRKTKTLSPSPASKFVPKGPGQGTLTESDLSSSNSSNVNFYNTCISNRKVQRVAFAECEKVKLKENFLPQKLLSKSEENLSPAARLAISSSDSPDSKSSSNCSSSEKTMKRKVLRRRNGEPVITEVIIKIPFELETSYPESDDLDTSKSFSGEDLSPKSQTSSGSSAVDSPKPSLKSSSSVLSLASKCSTATRILNSRKKKNDPVARYGYYKKFWDNFKPPGEKSHDKLRWAVRDKMLDYHL